MCTVSPIRIDPFPKEIPKKNYPEKTHPKEMPETADTLVNYR